MLIRVLLVLDSPSLQKRMTRLLSLPNVLVSTVSRRGNFWERITRQSCDLIVATRAVLSEPAAAQIAAVRSLPEKPEIIILSNQEDPEERASFLAAGCLAVIYQGLADNVLLETLSALVGRRREAVRQSLPQVKEKCRLEDFVVASPEMQGFVAMVKKVVASDCSLLILGETGVGKERLARAIHEESSRASGPFLTVNCGALPETLLDSELFGHEEGAFTGAIRAHRGYFEMADQGTIFLDEIGEMPSHLQVKLLRVLQERKIQRLGSERPVEVDVRVMAATNRDLHLEMQAKRFRPDLYYRLGVVALTVPPLRERREDIPILASSYLNHFAARLKRPISSLADDAMEALVEYSWPGNVRELINVIERAVLLCPGEQITLGDLPEAINSSRRVPAGPASAAGDGCLRRDLLLKPLRLARQEVVRNFERAYLVEVLRSTGGRVGQAALRAGIDPRSLFEKMREHGLRKEDFRHHPPVTAGAGGS